MEFCPFRSIFLWICGMDLCICLYYNDRHPRLTEKGEIFMDRRLRVLNAFDNRPVDRVPVGFWFHFSGDEAAGQACIDAHLKYYRTIKPDLMKIMSDSYFPYPFQIDIKEASDWRKVKPLGPDHPFIREQVERAKGITSEIKDECCTFYNVFAPFSSMRFGTSDELVMKHLKEDPEAVMYALGVVAEDNAAIARQVITEGGCDGIYYCVQGGELNRFTHEEYREYITPSDTYVLEQANLCSENNILHCCGWAGDKNHLENWMDYPAKAVNWAVFVEGLGLKEGKRLFGGKAVLGGFDNRKTGPLYCGTKEEVQAAVRRVVEENGTLGVILGGDCTLPGDIDKERIRWVMDAVEN